MFFLRNANRPMGGICQYQREVQAGALLSGLPEMFQQRRPDTSKLMLYSILYEMSVEEWVTRILLCAICLGYLVSKLRKREP